MSSIRLAALVTAAILASLALASPLYGQVTVYGQSNIYGAGHLTPPAPGGNGGGVLPTLVSLPITTNRTVEFTGVVGTIDYGACCPPNGPDGIMATDAYPAPLWDGLAGTDFPTRSRFMVGVFLDDTEPADPAPDRLYFADGAFGELSPGLRQIFFIGDGLTGTDTGAVQVFHVPDGATRLFLGFQDRYSSSPNVPGWYGDNSGSIDLTVTLHGDPTAVGERRPLAAPSLLGQNAPNPFNPSTRIAYEVPTDGFVSLTIHDLRGRRVCALVAGNRPAGRYEADWNGIDEAGRKAEAGVYLYRLAIGDRVEVRRMVLLK